MRAPKNVGACGPGNRRAADGMPWVKPLARCPKIRPRARAGKIRTGLGNQLFIRTRRANKNEPQGAFTSGNGGERVFG
jgi:hypothetical protein